MPDRPLNEKALLAAETALELTVDVSGVEYDLEAAIRAYLDAAGFHSQWVCDRHGWLNFKHPTDPRLEFADAQNVEVRLIGPWERIDSEGASEA